MLSSNNYRWVSAEAFLLTVILIALGCVGAPAQGTLSFSSVLILTHSRPQIKRPIAEIIRARRGFFTDRYSIDSQSFNRVYPDNAIYDRVIYELVRSDVNIHSKILAEGFAFSGDDIEEAVDRVLVSLIREQMGFPSLVPQRAGWLKPIQYEIGGQLHRDFSQWSYRDFIAIVDAVISPTVVALSKELKFFPSDFWEQYQRDDILDEVTADLWGRRATDPRKFVRGGKFGLMIESWARSEVAERAIKMQQGIPAEQPAPSVFPPSGTSVVDRFAIAGFSRPPRGYAIPERVWSQIVSELEPRLVALVGREVLDEYRVLDFNTPEYSLRDLRRELIFAMLQHQNRGFDLAGPNAAVAIANKTALSFLERWGLRERDDVVAEGGPAPEMALNESELALILALWNSKTGSRKYLEGFDRKYREKGTSHLLLDPDYYGRLEAEDASIAQEFLLFRRMVQFNLFFYNSLSAEESLHAFSMMQRMIAEIAPGLGLEVDTPLLARVWESLDTDLSVYWSKFRNQTPQLVASLTVFGQSIRRSVGRVYTERNQRPIESGESDDVAVKFWHTLSRSAATSLRTLAPYYGLTEMVFWKEYAESDVVEALGEAAAEWRRREFGDGTNRYEGKMVAARAIRGLCLKLAVKKEVSLPADWSSRLIQEKIDARAVFDLIPNHEVASTMRIWDSLPKEAEKRSRFEARFIRGIPPTVLPKDEGRDFLQHRVKSGFDRFMELWGVYRDWINPPIDLERLGYLIRQASEVADRLAILYTGQRRLEIGELAILEKLHNSFSTATSIRTMDDATWEVAVIKAGRAVVGEYLEKDPTGYGNDIPVSLVIVPDGSEITDSYWKVLVQRLPNAIERQARIFGLSVEEFWASRGGRYSDLEVGDALVASYLEWKDNALGPPGYPDEENEITNRAVWKLMGKIFRSPTKTGALRRPPSDWRDRMQRHHLERTDIMAMIPSAEFAIIFERWKVGSRHWNVGNRAGQTSKFNDRNEVFSDLFARHLTTFAMKQRHGMSDASVRQNRVTLFDSFIELYEQYQDASNFLTFVVPPERYPGDITLWLRVQENIKSALQELVPYNGDSAEDAWNELKGNVSLGVLSLLFAEEISRVDPTLGDDALRRRTDDISRAIALRIAQRKFSTPENVGREGALSFPSVAVVGAAAPMPVVRSSRSSGAEVSDRTPKERRELSPTVADKTVAAPREASGSPSPSPSLSEPTDGRQIVTNLVRERVQVISRFYLLAPSDFWKSEGGAYDDQDVQGMFEEEKKVWREKAYGPIDTEAKVVEAADRIARAMLKKLFHELPPRFPENWKDLLGSGDTDMEAIIDMLLPFDFHNLLMAWQEKASVSMVVPFQKYLIDRVPMSVELKGCAEQISGKRKIDLMKTMAFLAFMKSRSTRVR
jgi:hypothetical protein